jgi:NADH-quinone oxidoreductase subunit A
MTDLVGHFLLFTVVGVVFLLAPLILGWLVRPRLPTAEKQATYECGEPTIGSSYIQFDLRFYTVALLFIIFDVEVAFFFPWAMVYGGAMQLADTRLADPVRGQLSEKLLNLAPGTATAEQVVSSAAAFNLGLTGLADMLVFFGVLLLGFAYVWKRGDLDWVRAVAQQAQSLPAAGPSLPHAIPMPLPVRELEPVH